MGSDERGVRPNADLSMICAFMGKYAKDSVSLPANVSYQQLDTMALKTLTYAIDTHKAVRKKACIDGKYWGSISKTDYQWESSLWALSVAYSASFQWDKLSDTLKGDLYKLLKAECNYELERDIPTGYKYDTKAEENGWEVGVLAVTLGLFPEDELAPQWFERMREFAMNSYSHPSDASDTTVVTPWYDNKTVADLYKGPNLYPDWTLQNHGFFHTSYQNVVIQELGEAALALKAMNDLPRHLLRMKNAANGNQTETNGDSIPNTSKKGIEFTRHSFEKIDGKFLLHNCSKVAKNVLNWLTLPDGEQAMPNGNDWSLFLYDQVTSYSTLACMLQDPDDLLFEQRALEQISRRQRTTTDGSWLLNPDVGARRMGVETHRLMKSWLMHHYFPTGNMKATEWNDFANRYSEAKYFPCQRIVRTLTDNYFACFSFSEGKQSFTGYIEPLPHTLLLKEGRGGSLCSLVVPFRKFNTGNIIGFYDIEGTEPNAHLTGEPEIKTSGEYFSIEATLAENDSTILRHFTLRSTSKGLSYSDKVVPTGKRVKPTKDNPKGELRINADYTGMLAISEDPFAGSNHKIIYSNGMTIIDNNLTIKTNAVKNAVFTDLSTDNSITTKKLYPFYHSPSWKHKIEYDCSQAE